MAGGSLGSLTIDLAANITRFERSLTRAERLADKRSKSIQRTFTRMAAGIGAALVSFGFVRAVEQSLDFADSIGKTADKLGIGTDALQEYRFAAEQTGVAQTALDIGIQRFTRRLGEAQDGTGVLKDVLKSLGISLIDNEGNFKTTEVVLGEYADAIKNTENSQKQLLLAFKAFDTEGVALVNLLRQGSDGINAFRSEAQALGIVIDEDLIRNSEKANDQLNIMSKVLKVQLTEAAVALAPTIVEVGTAFADLAKGDFDKLPDTLKTIAVSFKAVDFAAGEATQIFGTFGAAVALLVQGEFSALNELLKENRERTAAAKDEFFKFAEILKEFEGGGLPEGGADRATIADTIDTRTNIITGLTGAEMEEDLRTFKQILDDAANASDAATAKRLKLEREFSAAKASIEQGTISNTLSLLSALGSKQKGFAIAAIALEKAVAIAQVVIATRVATSKALALYGSTALAAPEIASIEALGALNIGLIAATGIAQVAGLNAGGSVGGAAGTAGTATNPVITSSDTGLPQAGTQGTITINVNGVITDDIMQDLVVPAIQDAVNDKDIILIRNDSRQAIELGA